MAVIILNPFRCKSLEVFFENKIKLVFLKDVTNKERIEFLERERIKELQNKAKIFKRIGMSFFGSIWLGILLPFFGIYLEKYLSDTGIYVVMVLIVGLGVYFFVKSSKIEHSIRHYNKHNHNE